MSAAHALPGPGDLPTPAEAVPGEEPELRDATPAPAAEDLDDREEPGEEAPPRRAVALPDLRPYAVPDRDAVAELGHLAADVTRTAAPRVRRGLVPVLRALALVLRAWFAGELAPKVPAMWRLVGVPALVVYGVSRTVAIYPWAPLLLIPALPLAAVIAHRWAARRAKTEAAAKASGKTAGKASGKTAGEGGKGTAKEPAKAARRTLAARLADALTRPSAETSPEAPAKASAETSPEAPAETSPDPAEEAEEEPEDTPVQEAPPTPSRDDLVAALHTLVEGSSGVLHTALRDHLHYPSTRAVREALEAAHIPSRPGVRAVGGNGPGVNRRDFPPLPPPREGTPGDRCSRSSEAFTNNNNGGEGAGEGLGVDGSDQESRFPFDVVRDPEGGPSAWRIIHHK